MKYRRFGTTGVRVSTLGLGTMLFGGPTDEREATDRLDVLYLHRFDHRADLDHTLRALDRLVAAGDVLYLGVSNFAAWQIADALGRCALHGWAPITVFQPMYNLLKRQAEVELLPMAEALGLAVVPYSPLAGGLLSGKYGREPGTGAEGRVTADARYKLRYGDPLAWEAAAELGAIAGELGLHPATLAVAWAAGHPAVTAPLIAGRTLDQLRPSLAAADLDLDGDLRARITALTPPPPLATDRTEERH